MQPLKFLAALSLLLFSALAANAQSEYRIRAGDTLNVEVLEDSSLNRSVAVLPNGQVNFPFAGSVQAAGRTIGDVEAALRRGIGPNFANPPTVFVSVVPQREFPGSASAASDPSLMDVYFVGEVNQPGVVSVKRGTTLLQAIAVGGGVSRFAAIKRIQLRRTDPNTGVQRVTVLNYKALANGAVTNDIELKDGDVILVPERRLFE